MYAIPERLRGVFMTKALYKSTFTSTLPITLASLSISSCLMPDGQPVAVYSSTSVLCVKRNETEAINALSGRTSSRHQTD